MWALPDIGSTSSFRLAPEFKLVAACAVWPPSTKRCEKIRSHSLDVDWREVVRLARRHRVAGLVHSALACAGLVAPGESSRELADQAGETARQSLRFAAEALRLQTLFERSGIPVVFVKGAALAQLAYGSLAVRHAKDIDLLVPPEHVAAALGVMDAAGYKRILPSADLSDHLFELYLDRYKDCSYVHGDGRTHVDLHWKLDHALDFGSFNPFDSPKFVPITHSGALATLHEQDNFAYLCQHGARHCWFRLKWLADIGNLLERHDEAGVMRLYEAAEARGVGRHAAQALLLCHRLFESPVPADLKSRLASGRRNRLLEFVALRLMVGGGSTEPNDRPFGTTVTNLCGLLLCDSVPGLIHELRFHLTSWHDVETLPLPRSVQWLYPLLRLPLWLWRKAAAGKH